MTRMTRNTRRAGFTLIELLVAMSVVVVLASIAVIVVPDVMTQDRTTDGASTIRQHLMIAKARATRDNSPRGVRFITGVDPTNPSKPAGVATELQYVERPRAIVSTGAYVEFEYTPDGSGAVPLANRKCYLMNVVGVDAEMIPIIQNDLTIGFTPSLEIQSIGLSLPIMPPYPSPEPSRGPGAYLTALTPEAYALVDSLIGTGLKLRAAQFAIQPQSRPLLGEPNVQLPRNICVDLPSSTPELIANGDPIVMFTPGGQVSNFGSGQINLWVRDFTKNGGQAGVFEQGGEQQVVSVKTKSGALGVFPIAWPPSNPFQLARTGAASP